MATTKPRDRRLWLRRCLWLLAIWAASVTVMGLMAWLMRGLMQLIGLGR